MEKLRFIGILAYPKISYSGVLAAGVTFFI
jgi:hypothetical protein